MAQFLLFFTICVCVCIANAQFGFFPNQREDRRYMNPQGFSQNFLSYPRRMTDRLTGVLHLRPNGNPEYVYPFNNRPNRPISNNVPYDQYGRPLPPSQNMPNQYPQYPYGDPYARPVQFPNSRPYEGTNNNQYQDYNQYPSGEYTQVPTESQNPPFENPSQKLPDSDNQPEIPMEFPQPNEPTDESNVENYKTTRAPDANVSVTNHQQGFPPLPSGFDLSGLSASKPSPSPNETTEAFGFTQPPELPMLTPVPESDLPELTPVPVHQATELSELKPVPVSDSRNSFDFAPFQETCQTVDGGIGSCLSILSCEPYVKLLSDARSNNNPALVQTLRKAHCGFEGTNPKVCCPRVGFATALPSTPPTPPPTPPPTIAPTPESIPDPEPKTTDTGATFLQPPVCGSSNASFGRVVGGVDAVLGDFPWMALLGYKNRHGTGWNCGGSLVSAKHVLTAAHCIHGHEQSLYVVRLGELDTAREDDGASPIDILIAKKIMHEHYDRNAYTDDIALLVLQMPVTFTAMIRPICIPYPEELRANKYENYNPFIAGWGSIEFRGATATHLQVLQLPVVTNDYCKQAYSQYKAQKIDDRVLCAGYKRGKKDACQGDSGGPLMLPIWNSQTQTVFFFQIGVVSFGKKCAEPGFPGVYTRVTHFVPWLQKTMLANP